MGKRKGKKWTSPEVISFRPSSFARGIFAELATKWSISPGEAAKRLVLLQLHEMDVEFYPVVADLSNLLQQGPDFEQACEMIRVRHMEEHKESKQQGHKPPDRDRRLQIADELVRHFKMMRGLSEEVREELRVSIVRRGG